MALLLGCQSVSKAYGAAPLLRDLSLGIHDGDRIGVVGPNGCGKSTLLRILGGIEEPDSGTVSLRRGTRLAFVAQKPSFREGMSAEEVVAGALAAAEPDESARIAKARATLGRCGFPHPGVDPAVLSGGWQKRLAIAEAIAAEPDLLLLDEPTNHLDLEGILWLEELLSSHDGAFVVISHDRWFLENVARRMFDLDPVHEGGFFETKGSYSEFLERKDAALQEQARWQETLANRVRREVEWLRRGPKARTTKSRSRIDEAARLQGELAEVSARLDRRSTSLDFVAGDKRAKRLLVAEGVAKSYGGHAVVSELDLVISPGTRLGLLGANGSGKSTILGLLTGEITADRGRVERADGTRIVKLDQHRRILDPEVMLRRALAPEGDQVVFAGRPVHAVGWAQRFLFRSEQLSMPVGRLSGGEQARLLLATLMLQPADVLILDEPTNDLDIPTLEVLEEALVEFPGAVILVTHDRYLFEKVTTTVIGLDGRGGALPYADYSQWERTRRERANDAKEPRRAAADAAATSNAEASPAAKPRAKKLSYMEQREWDGMEAAILEAEAKAAEAEALAHDPAVFTQAAELARRLEALAAAQSEVERLYARWAELEGRLAG